MVEESANLMRDINGFVAAMTRAIRLWPNSCDYNLSHMNKNRLAWLGHAGCFVSVGSREDATREAWHTLSITEQEAANRAAEAVISNWKPECQNDQLGLMF